MKHKPKNWIRLVTIFISVIVFPTIADWNYYVGYYDTGFWASAGPSGNNSSTTARYSGTYQWIYTSHSKIDRPSQVCTVVTNSSYTSWAQLSHINQETTVYSVTDYVSSLYGSGWAWAEADNNAYP